MRNGGKPPDTLFLGGLIGGGSATTLATTLATAMATMAPIQTKPNTSCIFSSILPLTLGGRFFDHGIVFTTPLPNTKMLGERNNDSVPTSLKELRGIFFTSIPFNLFFYQTTSLLVERNPSLVKDILFSLCVSPLFYLWRTSLREAGERFIYICSSSFPRSSQRLILCRKSD